MIGSSNDRRALEREALRNVINQWNANRLDLFELSEPNEDLEFHGVMRFYFQDSGQKVATKCIRVASDATVEDVIGTLVEKFRPDMRMLSVPSYALYELHEGCAERKMSPDEKPLLVQLNWHVDDREGRFLLRNIDDKTVGSMGSLDSNASFRRKLSKREKKQLKKQEKLSRMKSENGDINGGQDNVTEKLYNELPETSFTRSISNPEAVMRRRRQQKLEKKLQQFRSKDGGPDTGGTLKIYGEALCKDVPYKTLLLSVRDCAGAVVREMLDKYGLTKVDPSQFCLVQVTQQPGIPDTEYVLDDDECPLSILMTAPNTGSIMFHVRRRPADCAPRKRKKKPGALSGVRGEQRGDVPLLVELGPDGQTAHLGDANKTIRLVNEMMEVGSANGIALQLYAPHIQPRHCVITNAEGVTSLTPCHADAHTFVNGQRIHQTTILTHGSLVKFGNSNTYRFLDPTQEERTRHPLGNLDNQARIYESRSPRALSPTQASGSRENIETTFDIDGNVETVSTHSGAREDNRSLGSDSRSENRLSDMARFPRGQDPILPAVLEFPEEHQEQFLARAITHLDVTTPTFRLAPAYTLYLCARYRASTHYRPELTPTERAHKLTLLLQHAAMLIRHTVQDRSTESTSQAFWLANASELLHFLKSDRHVSAFSLQAQDTLADAVRLSFKNLVACLTDELNSAMNYLMSVTGDDHPREVINILSGAMNLLRKCRVNAALTIQLFSQLFHWISAKALSNVISNSNLCTRNFGHKLANRLRNLQAWAESQGLELAAECHLAKIVQCSHLLQASKYTPEDLANLSAACFKLNSMQLGALLMQYKAEPGEKIASPSLLEQAAKAAESVADELARAEGREVTLYEDPAPPLQLLLPEDGFSCDVVQGVPPGLADFLIPLQTAGLCRLAAQPTSSGHWTVYMNAPRPPSVLSATQPEVQVIRLHKAGGGMGLSIVAAKGAGQERLGIYIKSVVPGGAADKDGRLAAGDQLLSVDGQSLLGITQEKAAEFLVRTGSVVTLEVAKGGAVYHGLATLLQQPSPTPHRGPRRMSERDLPSRVDSERSIPSSKSVPALHQIHSPNQDPPRTPGGQTSNFLVDGRTSSNNSINTNNLHGGVQNGPAALRSRSTHNLNQQDAGFYQNLSVYRNKMPSPQQLGDRTSALRSSQNSLQSSITSPPNSQRPSSAYYPTNQTPNFNRPNLHQSIPNLKSPPSMQRLQQGEESGRLSGSYPNMGGQGQQYYGQHPAYTPGQQPPYQRQGNQQNYQGPGSDDLNRSQYGSPYSNSNQPYPSPTHSGNPNYSQANNIQNNYSHTMPHQLHGSSNLPPNLNSSNKMEDRGDSRMDQRSYANTNPGGLLREDIYRQAQTNKHEDMMRYPSTNNVRISEAQIQSSRGNEDLNRHQEIRTSKSEDMLKHHHQGEMMRYASSGNIRAHDLNQPLRPSQDHMHQHRMNNDDRSLRGGQAKLVEMGEEVRRRQQQQQSQARLMNQTYSPQQMQHNAYYQQQQHYYNTQMAQSMQNLSINPTYQNQQPLTQASSGYNQHYPQSTAQQATYQTTTNSTYYSGHGPTSPSYRPQNMNQKTPKRTDSPPALPPTSTHPLYSPTAQGDSSSTIYTASNQDPPKMAFYPATPSTTNSKPPRDPWAREEQERQQEARREAARQWQEQQIKELISLPYRTSQQEEQLRALQLEREFQRRAQEAAGEDDEDTEKESPSPQMPQPVSSQTVISTVPSTTVSSKQEPSQVPPTSILKPGGVNTNQIPPVINSQREVLSTNQGPISPTETTAPPPPERGSSFAVMSMRAKDGVGKRVSFDPVSTQNNVQQTPQIPTSLPVEESVREDPNSFIMQAESMLASPTTPNEASPNVATATPGVIGAQEVYRDPRARRLAEQQKKNMNENSPVPEKLSFKEKMKMFAMETGEQGTPKDKSKISRAQREIDNLGTAPSSGMVH
ncbi:adherens junction formation factor afadin isoform X9 [Rhynchophorus ferrugineus]|uniref:adherens junction formation factor afadin isoform X9 n=1 Tax=Rhynchophorus ferrugineus TaxID=354439 RepID=UPI003FCD7A7B